jgi:hypothetical protein
MGKTEETSYDEDVPHGLHTPQNGASSRKWRTTQRRRYSVATMMWLTILFLITMMGTVMGAMHKPLKRRPKIEPTDSKNWKRQYENESDNTDSQSDLGKADDYEDMRWVDELLEDSDSDDEAEQEDCEEGYSHTDVTDPETTMADDPVKQARMIKWVVGYLDNHAREEDVRVQREEKSTTEWWTTFYADQRMKSPSANIQTNCTKHVKTFLKDLPLDLQGELRKVRPRLPPYTVILRRSNAPRLGMPGYPADMPEYGLTFTGERVSWNLTTGEIYTDNYTVEGKMKNPMTDSITIWPALLSEVGRALAIQRQYKCELKQNTKNLGHEHDMITRTIDISRRGPLGNAERRA